MTNYALKESTLFNLNKVSIETWLYSLNWFWLIAAGSARANKKKQVFNLRGYHALLSYHASVKLNFNEDTSNEFKQIVVNVLQLKYVIDIKPFLNLLIYLLNHIEMLKTFTDDGDQYDNLYKEIKKIAEKRLSTKSGFYNHLRTYYWQQRIALQSKKQIISALMN